MLRYHFDVFLGMLKLVGMTAQMYWKHQLWKRLKLFCYSRSLQTTIKVWSLGSKREVSQVYGWVNFHFTPSKQIAIWPSFFGRGNISNVVEFITSHCHLRKLRLIRYRGTGNVACKIWSLNVNTSIRKWSNPLGLWTDNLVRKIVKFVELVDVLYLIFLEVQ